jgi:hypothetical protein
MIAASVLACELDHTVQLNNKFVANIADDRFGVVEWAGEETSAMKTWAAALLSLTSQRS